MLSDGQSPYSLCSQQITYIPGLLYYLTFFFFKCIFTCASSAFHSMIQFLKKQYKNLGKVVVISCLLTFMMFCLFLKTLTMSSAREDISIKHYFPRRLFSFGDTPSQLYHFSFFCSLSLSSSPVATHRVTWQSCLPSYLIDTYYECQYLSRHAKLQEFWQMMCMMWNGPNKDLQYAIKIHSVSHISSLRSRSITRVTENV